MMVIKLNIGKCKVISYGRNIDDCHIYNISAGDRAATMEHIDHFNEHGVLLMEN